MPPLPFFFQFRMHDCFMTRLQPRHISKMQHIARAREIKQEKIGTRCSIESQMRSTSFGDMKILWKKFLWRLRFIFLFTSYGYCRWLLFVIVKVGERVRKKEAHKKHELNFHFFAFYAHLNLNFWWVWCARLVKENLKKKAKRWKSAVDKGEERRVRRKLWWDGSLTTWVQGYF